MCQTDERYQDLVYPHGFLNVEAFQCWNSRSGPQSSAVASVWCCLLAANPLNRGYEFRHWVIWSRLHRSGFQSRLGWLQVRWKLLMETERRLTLMLSFTLCMRSSKISAFLICCSQFRMPMTIWRWSVTLSHVLLIITVQWFIKSNHYTGI